MRYFCGFLLFFSLTNITIVLGQTKIKSKVNKVIIDSMINNAGEVIDSIELVLIRGGTFTMGSNNNENEQPMHPVTVNSFYMSIYEITVEQWIAIMGNNLTISDCNKCPINLISWNDVQEALARLSKKSGKQYRLPTEAEWEYAARGGAYSKHYRYCGSNDIDEVAYVFYQDPYPVGQKKPNELGLYDMSGNVWEMCSDWYDENYYKQKATDNPKGPASGKYKVIRGGFYHSYPFTMTPTYRSIGNDPDHLPLPSSRWKTLGFRVVRECE